MRIFELAVGVAVEVLLFGIAFAVLYRLCAAFWPVPKKQVVPALHNGVIIRKDEVEKIVGPGAYWITPSRSLFICDMRPTPFQLHACQLFTSDQREMRVGLSGEYRVMDPGLFVTGSRDAFSSICVELNHALQTAIAEASNREIGTGRGLIANRIRELVLPRASHLGIQLEELELSDVFQPTG